MCSSISSAGTFGSQSSRRTYPLTSASGETRGRGGAIDPVLVATRFVDDREAVESQVFAIELRPSRKLANRSAVDVRACRGGARSATSETTDENSFTTARSRRRNNSPHKTGYQPPCCLGALRQPGCTIDGRCRWRGGR